MDEGPAVTNQLEKSLDSCRSFHIKTWEEEVERLCKTSGLPLQTHATAQKLEADMKNTPRLRTSMEYLIRVCSRLFRNSISAASVRNLLAEPLLSTERWTVELHAFAHRFQALDSLLTCHGNPGGLDSAVLTYAFRFLFEFLQFVAECHIPVCARELPGLYVSRANAMDRWLSRAIYHATHRTMRQAHVTGPGSTSHHTSTARYERPYLCPPSPVGMGHPGRRWWPHPSAGPRECVNSLEIERDSSFVGEYRPVLADNSVVTESRSQGLGPWSPRLILAAALLGPGDMLRDLLIPPVRRHQVLTPVPHLENMDIHVDLEFQQHDRSVRMRTRQHSKLWQSLLHCETNGDPVNVLAHIAWYLLPQTKGHRLSQKSALFFERSAPNMLNLVTGIAYEKYIANALNTLDENKTIPAVNIHNLLELYRRYFLSINALAALSTMTTARDTLVTAYLHLYDIRQPRQRFSGPVPFKAYTRTRCDDPHDMFQFSSADGGMGCARLRGPMQPLRDMIPRLAGKAQPGDSSGLNNLYATLLDDHHAVLGYFGFMTTEHKTGDDTTTTGDDQCHCWSCDWALQSARRLVYIDGKLPAARVIVHMFIRRILDASTELNVGRLWEHLAYAYLIKATTDIAEDKYRDAMVSLNKAQNSWSTIRFIDLGDGLHQDMEMESQEDQQQEKEEMERETAETHPFPAVCLYKKALCYLALSELHLSLESINASIRITGTPTRKEARYAGILTMPAEHARNLFLRSVVLGRIIDERKRGGHHAPPAAANSTGEEDDEEMGQEGKEETLLRSRIEAARIRTAIEVCLIEEGVPYAVTAAVPDTTATTVHRDDGSAASSTSATSHTMDGSPDSAASSPTFVPLSPPPLTALVSTIAPSSVATDHGNDSAPESSSDDDNDDDDARDDDADDDDDEDGRHPPPRSVSSPPPGISPPPPLQWPYLPPMGVLEEEADDKGEGMGGEHRDARERRGSCGSGRGQMRTLWMDVKGGWVIGEMEEEVLVIGERGEGEGGGRAADKVGPHEDVDVDVDVSGEEVGTDVKRGDGEMMDVDEAGDHGTADEGAEPGRPRGRWMWLSAEDEATLLAYDRLVAISFR